MVNLDDEIGETTIFTRRALVLAVGEGTNFYEGCPIKPGDVVWYHNVDTQLVIEDPYAKGGPKKYRNPNTNVFTFKKMYLDEEDPALCALIWTHQIQATEGNEDYIFSVEIGDSN